MGLEVNLENIENVWITCQRLILRSSSVWEAAWCFEGNIVKDIKTLRPEVFPLDQLGNG